MSTTISTKQEVEIFKRGRATERLSIITALEDQAKEILKSNPEHALHLGFIIQKIRDMDDL